jgi:hypothetical protein
VAEKQGGAGTGEASSERRIGVSGIDFHRTVMGAKFYNKDVPDLVRNLARIADALEKIVSNMGKEEDDGRHRNNS